ncbi:MAG: ParA family protein [Proteobacteria bacterium]|nr:ParA family protein [Pseudomonadota bacterium]
MRKVAVINQKGGTGKTTTTVNLAAALAEQGRQVLIIDWDSQANASSWLGAEGGDTLLEAITQERPLEEIVQSTTIPNVDLIPSSISLVKLERFLAGEIGAESILRDRLEKLPSNWDVVLIDCPPTLSLQTINALVGVDEIIVPTEAHFLGLEGLAQLLKTVQKVKERLNPDLKITGILPCRVDQRNCHSKDVVNDIRTHFNGTAFETVIRENVRLAEAPGFRKPIIQYDGKSNGAKDYRALADEFLTRGEQSHG